MFLKIAKLLYFITIFGKIYKSYNKRYLMSIFENVESFAISYNRVLNKLNKTPTV